MQKLFENWRRFVNETTRDTYNSEVVDRNKATFKDALVEKDNNISPDEAIAEEGGALGFSKWEELTGMSREELEKYVKDNDHIKIHKHGDIIDTRGLCEDIEITEDIVVDEGKICAAGIAWAKRTYDKWPSAYASMGASKHCKKKGKKKKKRKKSKRKNESLQEAKKEGMEIEEGELAKWRRENWTQSDGTPCGEAKAQKNPKRCKPAAKWATMSASEKEADDAKKKKGGKRGKQFVAATKKGKVRGYSENIIHEGHGLSKKDVDYLSDAISSLSDKELKRILRFLVKSNVEVSKTKDISKEKKK